MSVLLDWVYLADYEKGMQPKLVSGKYQIYQLSTTVYLGKPESAACLAFRKTLMNKKHVGSHIMISKELLEILACPQCKGPVELRSNDGLLCKKCRLLYEIKDDIPIMLIDKAKKLDDQ
jgi:uncharacterized protein YbaR (Trm112 family)